MCVRKYRLRADAASAAGMTILNELVKPAVLCAF